MAPSRCSTRWSRWPTASRTSITAAALVWRFYDLPRAIQEMQVFLDVFLSEKRPAYGQQKIEKAKDDLARMKKGEVPSVYLAGQGTYTPPARKGAK